MAGATMMAYVGDSMMAISKNETPPDPTDPWTWKRAMQLSGAAGLYGDVLFGEAQRLQQGGIIQQMAGPMASKVAEGIGVTAALTRDVVMGEETDKDALKAFNYLVRQAPGNNIFYLKTGMDRLFLDRIRNGIDEDFEDDRQNRLERSGREELFDF
jgi:hypothetical protein